ncbi:tetratricopeptide repeat protein [Jeotgalibacillus soli]|uniref:Tetratricopeptide repeat protein n=1 Tax=Jeotgalibacillus soli TaxID=889306 RepID=A0A0C2VJC6_9BACL|nr:tetratricopeptide repeat protein [Jeotgalibacillus soli]KIL44586.1 hypothetical protein KP78_35500 [Jeotgalibacillus soli]
MPNRPGNKGSRERKVIPFPGLKDRLVEKGLARLQDQQHEEAIELLLEAYKIAEEDAVVNLTLAVAYYENRQWSLAKTLCERMLHEGFGNYEEVLELYILNLIQLKEYDRIAATIETVMEERVLSPDREEQFLQLLSMSKRQEQQEEDKALQAFVLEQELEQQMIQVANLSKQNIYPIRNDLISSLKEKEVHPFIKSMVLNVLREQGIQDFAAIEKWNKKLQVIPAELEDPFQSLSYLKVQQEIDSKIGHADPYLVDLTTEIVKRHVFLLYPLTWQHKDEALLAKAYIQLAYQYMGQQEGWGDLADSPITKELEILEKASII